MTTHFWGILQWFEDRRADQGLVGMDEVAQDAVKTESDQ
jgi:hypothetical protein